MPATFGSFGPHGAGLDIDRATPAGRCRAAAAGFAVVGASLVAIGTQGLAIAGPLPAATRTTVVGQATAGAPHHSGHKASPSEHVCNHPVFSSSAQFGIWDHDGYNVYNNMWDMNKPPASGPGSQSLHVCDYNSWYVVADMPLPGQPADSVKTYPNVQENFSSVPVTKFSSLRSTFAEADPHVGDYEDAYDMWLNGIASHGSNEVMIWNEDHGQVPAGSPRARASFNGVTYTAWSTPGNGYIAFVANRYFTAGTVNLLAFYRWLIAKGWIPSSSTVDQIDYGVEICSTGAAPAKFDFTNFSITYVINRA